jgi:hypothetical protein
LHPSKEVVHAPSAAGEKNPATALWLLRQRWSILDLDKIMNTKAQSFSQRVRQIFRQHRRQHDPMLVFNMSIFNYHTDGWSRTFSTKYEYARFSG